MISERQFHDALNQINVAFAKVSKQVERLEQQIKAIQEDKPKIGRPKKEAA